MFNKPTSPKILVAFCVLFLLLIKVVPAEAQTEAVWYVTNAGDDANDCLAIDTPCATINAAIGKASAGDIIKVAVGTYTSTGNEVVLVDKSMNLSGGWDSSFTLQEGYSIIDGQSLRRGVTIANGNYTLLNNPQVFMEYFVIQNGFTTFPHVSGGGIFSYGDLTLNHSKVINNFVLNGDGGGIFSYGDLIINESTIANNKISTQNVGGGGGGGIMANRGKVTINNSTISGNQIKGSRDGNAFYSLAESATLNNSTVSGNFGTEETIYVRGGIFFLNNSTIADNQGYGFYNEFGEVFMQNTILDSNHTGVCTNPLGCGECFNGNGSVVSKGYNLVRNGYNCDIQKSTGDKIGTNSKPISAFLSPLQDNGGPTLTYALSYGSPAINAGNPGTPGSGENTCNATDQRGKSRPLGSACDIGAYEGHLLLPRQISPLGNVADATPTYKWYKVPKATRYQYQLYQGTKLIYTKTVLSGACGTSSCANTPKTTLKNGNYKWRIRAMVNGVWQGYSAFDKFIVFVPNTGMWKGYEVEFNVPVSQKNVEKFSIYINSLCGTIKVTYNSPVPIKNKKFKFDTGSFVVDGSFKSGTFASGSAIFSDYVFGCGDIYVARLWSAKWISAKNVESLTEDAQIIDVTIP